MGCAGKIYWDTGDIKVALNLSHHADIREQHLRKKWKCIYIRNHRPQAILWSSKFTQNTAR